MKRAGIILGWLAALLLAVAPVPASAQQTGKWVLGVIGDNGEAVTSGRCRVLTTGTNTQPTIYSDANLTTTATNPITLDTTTGTCGWFSSTSSGSASSFDVIVVVDSGAYKGARVNVTVTRTGAKTVRVSRSNPSGVLMVPLPSAAAVAHTTDSRTLPSGAMVTNVIVETTTAVAGSNAVVGLADPAVSTGGTQTHPTTAFCAAGFSTATVGFTSCAALTQNPYIVATPTAGPSSYAVIVSNQNHASAGYAWIYYEKNGTQP